MSRILSGRRVAVLVADEGVEQEQLTQPWQAIEQEAGRPVLVAPRPGAVYAYRALARGSRFPVHAAVGDADPVDFAGVLLPGGLVGADRLRTEPAAVAFVAAVVATGRPVAAICHAPWLLIEAGVLAGKRLTSAPSLRTDIRNAGGEWVDADVVVSGAGGWVLVTSRQPGDLPAFCREAVAAYAA